MRACRCIYSSTAATGGCSRRTIFHTSRERLSDAGAIAVVLDYDLMPLVRLADVVRQVREAKKWVSENIHLYGGDASRLTVSGHSAGAHLATFLLTEGEEMPPRGALLLGGVYDLRPLRQSFLQPLIQLTDDEVCQFSPIDKHFQPRVNTVILYGERETPPVPRSGRRARMADKRGWLRRLAIRPLQRGPHEQRTRSRLSRQRSWRASLFANRKALICALPANEPPRGQPSDRRACMGVHQLAPRTSIMALIKPDF